VNDSSNAADWSIRANIQVGDQFFGDRTYTIKSLPPVYAGSAWVRTAADSKAYTGATLASFKVGANAEVLVAFDDRVTSKPTWLSAGGWTDAGTDLVDSEATPVTFSLYKKVVAANSTVSLGPNGQSSGCLQYVVIVKDSNATPAPTPTPTVVTPTPTVATPTPTLTPTPTGSTPSPTGSGEFDANVPVGWAVVPGYGLQTTTGGAGGEVVTVTSGSQLAGYAGDATPRIIRIQGTLSGSDVNIGSNKTLIGMGANARISGFYLNLLNSQNVIIRNLTISGGTDAIAARYTNHLWIDRINTYSCGDGLIDITRESDMYTVSRVWFHDHHKTMLLNGGSTHRSDEGKLNGTVYHCWFDGSDTRNPRTGFGMIHVLNNLYNNNGYCVGLHSLCKTVVERNYFKNTSGCIEQMYTFDKNNGEYGSAISIDNIFDNSSGNDADGVGFTVTNYYLYNFMADPVANVPAIVQADVGPKAEHGEIGLMPIPGQGAVGVTDSVLSWKTGTASPTSYNVYFGTTTTPSQVATTASTSYNAGSLVSGVTYYWCVDQITSNGTIKGKLWTFKAK
jgi:pectate lyase